MEKKRYDVTGFIPHTSEIIEIVKCAHHDMALGAVADFHAIGADAVLYDNKNKAVEFFYCGK